MPRRLVPDAEAERAWLAGLRAGEMPAFEAIYTAYFTALWEFAARSVSPAVAEEIVQDVFFALWRRRAEITLDDHLGPYLFAAVRSKTIQHARHVRVVEDTARRHAEAPLGSGMPPVSPDDGVVFAELQRAVAEAIGQLTELQRNVLTLRWTQGMTYGQIATVLGISQEAAKKHGARAQKVVLPLLEPFATNDR
jgi:RNA polymerase sigma-70 factor (ECF subfamily)